MRKFVPYILSLLLGAIFGYILFLSNGDSLVSIFKENIEATAFQLGVFNNIDSAKDLSKKYDSAIIIKDEDVFRVYYSVLTNSNTISLMEDYLNRNKIAFYKKNIIVNDKALINSLDNYEKTMINVKDDTFKSINDLIMESYGGTI